MKRNLILEANKFVILFLICSSISCSIISLDGWIDKKIPDGITGQSPAFDEKNLFLDFPCIPYPRVPQYALVTKVIDGDSIIVSMEGEEYEVRYIGIDAPEFDEETFNQALSSKRANQELVEGRQITLYKDVSNTDRYGRLLRYVFLDDIFINLELVEKGLAKPKSYPPDIACQRLLNSAGEKTE